MKIVFDTNVYVAEALTGGAAARVVAATLAAGWRVYCSDHIADELSVVIREALGLSQRFASLTRMRVQRRSVWVDLPSSRHVVPDDPKDNPILQTALAAGADYLVSRDAHLLSLGMYEGVNVISVAAYYRVLEDQGLL
jgi:putative PIN family toxin of toxin-antitoxin system